MKNNQDPIYRNKVYKALKGELGDSFNKTEEEFNSSLDNEKDYSSKVYKALKGELGDSFNKTEEEFNSNIYGNTKTAVDPKGVKAESQDGGFQFLSASTNSSSESNKKNSPSVTDFSDESIDLYERYKEVVGGSITLEQESEIQDRLSTELKTRKLEGYRDVFEADGEDFDSYKDMSFEDFLKTDVSKKRENELLKSFKSKNRREFLENLSDEDKEKLQQRIEPLYHNKGLEVQDLASEIEVQKDYILKIEEVFKSIEQKKNLGEALTEEDIAIAQESAEKYLSIIDDFHKNEVELSQKLPELGSFEDQLGALKRTNNWFMDNVHRASESIFSTFDSITEFIGETETSSGLKTKDLHKNIYDPIKKALSNTVQFARDHKKEDIDLNSVETPSEFLSWGREQFVSQVGNILLAATGSPELAFLGIGASQGGSKIQELKNKGSFSDDQIRMAAIFEFIKGGTVGLVEKGVLGRATRALKNAKNLVKTPVEKVVAEGVLDTSLEAASESADIILSNVYSKQILGEDTHVLEGVKEGVISSVTVSGGIQGATRGSAIALNHATEAVRKVSDKKKYNLNKKKAQDIYTQMQALSEDNPLKKDLQKKLKSLLDENSTIIKNDSDKLNALTEDNAKEIIKSDKKLKVLFDKRKEISQAKELTEDLKKELLQENTDEIKSVTKKKELIIENPDKEPVLRDQAIQNIIVKQKENGVEKPFISAKDITKEYNRLTKEFSEKSYNESISAVQESFEPVFKYLRENIIDRDQSIDSIEKKFTEQYKSSRYYQLQDEATQHRIDLNMADSFRRLSEDFDRVEKPKQGVLDYISNKANEVNEALINEYSQVDKTLKEVYGNRLHKDFYEKKKLYKGKIRNDITNYTSRVNSFAKDVEKSSLTIRQLDQALKAQHALEADKHVSIHKDAVAGFSGGINIVEAKNILNSLTPEQKQDFEKFSKIYKDFVEENRNKLRELGRIDEETFNAYTDYYDNYLSLKGFANEDIDIDNSNKTSSKLSTKSAKEKLREGKAVESANAISNLLDAYANTVEQGHKDVVISALASMYDPNFEGNIFEVYEKASDLPFDMREDKDARITFTEDGKTKYLAFHNKKFTRIFNNADKKKERNVLLKLGASYIHAMKGLITTYNPEFLISNGFRDTQVAFRSISKELETNPDLEEVDGAKIRKYMRGNVRSSFKVLSKALNNKEYNKDPKLNALAKDFLGQGASSSISQVSIDTLKKRLENTAKLHTKKAKFLDKTKGLANKVANIVETGNSVVENVHRFNAFAALKEQGVDSQTAARIAKDLTIDFDQSGVHGSTASAVYYFFNAAIQGNLVFLKNLTTFKRNSEGKFSGFTRAQKGLAALPVFTFLNTIAAISFSEEDEDGKTFYEKDPEYLKRNALRFYLGDKEGMTGTIPLSYGSNVLAYTGVLAAEVTMGVRSPKDAAINFMEAAVDIVSPISPASSEENSLIKTFTPSILQTPVNLALNENFFGSPIYNDSRFTDKSDSNNSRRNTPEYLKATAEYLNEISGGNSYRSGSIDIHPETLGYIIETSAGGLGKFISNTVSTVGAVVDDRRDVEINKIPILRKFVHKPNKLLSVYEFKDKHDFIKTQDKALFEDYEKALAKGNKDEAQKIYKEGLRVSKVLSQYNEASKKLKEIQKAKEALSSETNEEKVIKATKYYEDLTIKISKKLNGYYNKKLGKSYN